ncbi:MAG TPA: molybdopterin molybdotransferase MoeA [Puia sp.]|nr:molybdopterin molybdotransferase MoeA [Puia sp.]
MLINYRQAREIVLSQARSFGREEVSLEQAFGRVLSETVRADRDYPPFDRATMDGYALRYADLELGIRRFRVAGVLYAGGRPEMNTVIGAGECFRIMTGAAVPAPADIVIRRENVKEGDPFVELPGTAADLPSGVLPAPADPSFPWRPWQNIARQGEDLAAGEPAIEDACVCEPAVIGLLATLGRAGVTVERLPRVSILTTGNEVVPVGVPVGPVQIRNSNRWQLEAALRKGGIVPAVCTHAPDDPAALHDQLQTLIDDDLLILCGGVSAGDADHVPAALESVGIKKLFHKIAMRPGKPTWCGVTPSGRMVFALPGNPFSTFVNMTLLIQPFLQACFGLPPSGPMGVPLGVERKKRSPLDEFFPVYVHGSPVRAEPVALNGSGDIRLGRQANALALHPAESGALAAGAEVPCYLL